MRRKFSLDLPNLERLAVLIHGPYGSGKTHLQGDFLKWAREQGEVRFLNIDGEDGYTSLARAGLGEIGETVENLDDYDAALAEYSKKGLFGLAVDSLSAFYRLMLKSIVGSVRYPDPSKDGEKAKMYWGQLSMGVEGRAVASRHAAKYVLWVSPYDKSEDPIAGGSVKTITPNLPGKLAHGCAGWFDFVGYLTAETLVSGVKRKMTFAPTGNILTRQRLPTTITQDIQIPEGGGGWVNFMNAVNQAMQTKGA